MIWGTYESEEHRIVEEKMRKILTGRDAKKGTYNGDTTYCPVNAYGDCPYCDQCNVCHIDDPMEDCDDWGAFWDSWEDWINADDVDPDAPEDFADAEIGWAMLEMGYNPYIGCRDDDC